MNIIESEIKKIQKEVTNSRKVSEEYVFGMVCYKYFFNDGEFANLDIEESFTDGRADGGIDLIAINEQEDSQRNLVLIQSKYGENIDKNDIKNIFFKMSETIKKFEENKASEFNSKLKKVYRENYDDIKNDDKFAIELVLFLGKKNFTTKTLISIKENLKTYLMNVLYILKMKLQNKLNHLEIIKVLSQKMKLKFLRKMDKLQ